MTDKSLWTQETECTCAVAPSSEAAVVAGLLRHIQEQERFCKSLETIADGLPDLVDPHDCLVAARGVVPLMMRAHTFEERELHPLLLQRQRAPGELSGIIERLRFEHLGDEVFAEDLCLALRQFATDRPSSNVESLAWMLRGFFEGVRRHLAFEREHLLPLLSERG